MHLPTSHHRYQKGVDYQLAFAPPSADAALTVTILELSTESCCDKFSVLYGSAALGSATALTPPNGLSGAFSSLPEASRSFTAPPGQVVLLRFRSDEIFHGMGVIARVAAGASGANGTSTPSALCCTMCTP